VKSIDEKLELKKDAKALVEKLGAATGVVDSTNPTEILTGGIKDWKDLADSTKLQKYRDADPKLRTRQIFEERVLDELQAKRGELNMTMIGKPERAEVLDQIERRISQQKAVVDSYIRKRQEFASEKKLLETKIKRDDDSRAAQRKRSEEEAKRKEAEEAKRKEAEATPTAGAGGGGAGRGEGEDEVIGRNWHLEGASPDAFVALETQMMKLNKESDELDREMAEIMEELSNKSPSMTREEEESLVVLLGEKDARSKELAVEMPRIYKQLQSMIRTKPPVKPRELFTK
jgi:peptidoglycan hydrolase CwlO-like protein